MKSIHRHLYFWVLLAIVAGCIVGAVAPEFGASLKPVSDAFIALIKMLIAPIVFCTVVLGITQAGDMKKVGRIGVKTLVYFEVVSTIALLIGLAAGNILKPGADFHADPARLDAAAVAGYAKQAQDQHVADYLLHIIPKSFFDALTGNGDLLQVLLIAILFGYALNRTGEKGRAVHAFIEEGSRIFFAMVNVVMKLAPLGAGAAMAFTIGKYGIGSLKPLLSLMAIFYLTCILFISGGLGLVAHLAGFNIFRFLRAIGDEILVVLGTSSSESVLAPLMAKLEKMGCPKDIVGLVVPSGYSFNLDGTNIYLTLATLFVAQALGIDLSFRQQMTIFAVAMLTSKGASGVTGAGFITLAATLAVVPGVPVAGLALILGVDRFMSEARAITNLIGNGVAAIVISKWEKELDTRALERALAAK
ncbi:MAG: dicarboxylate/amino acid:cation symporter [Alphaproteobacteria bacterium]|nr:MAG: dicarboxylate/amino acid:cation symporter [Alphaproteobacteria bacterium]